MPRKYKPAAPRRLRIDTNVPLVTSGVYRPRTATGRIAVSLGVGHSVFSDSLDDINKIRYSLLHLGRKSTYQARFEKGKWGWRIWRLPDDK